MRGEACECEAEVHWCRRHWRHLSGAIKVREGRLRVLRQPALAMSVSFGVASSIRRGGAAEAPVALLPCQRRRELQAPVWGWLASSASPSPSRFLSTLRTSSFGPMIDQSMVFSKQNPLHSYKNLLRREFLFWGLLKALSGLFFTCDKVHGAGSAASAKAQLDWSCAYRAKVGNLQKETVLAKAIKMQ